MATLCASPPSGMETKTTPRTRRVSTPERLSASVVSIDTSAGRYLVPQKLGPYVVHRRVLGEGTSSVVAAGTDSRTLTPVAVKIINRRGLSDESLLRLFKEVAILRRLAAASEVRARANCVHFLDLFDSGSLLCLVFEHIRGIELLETLSSRPSGLGEDVAGPLFASIAQSVEMLHAHGVVHLDLKLENVMIDYNTRTVRLIDFGFAEYVGEHEERLLTTACGSVNYVPPEMLLTKKFSGKKADVWSLGIVLFALLTNEFPFDGETDEATFRQIMANQYLSSSWTTCLSPACVDLIKRMLNPNPNLRPSMAQVLQHPWVRAFMTHF